MINGTIFILKLVNFSFLGGAVPRYPFRNLFVLQECVLMLITSTTEAHFLLLSYLNKVIDIINFVKNF